MDKAKHNVAARNKLLASATVDEATESVSSYPILFVYARLTFKFVFIKAQRSRQPKYYDTNKQSKLSKIIVYLIQFVDY